METTANRFDAALVARYARRKRIPAAALADGRPEITTRPLDCIRCGGTGRYPSAHYRGICLRCDGDRTDPRHRLFEIVGEVPPAFAAWIERLESKKAAKAEAKRAERARQEAEEAAQEARERAAWAETVPAVAAALAARETLSERAADILETVLKRRSASERQIAALERALEPAEQNVPAPEGRQTVEGVIVSIKTHESAFGISEKMTVKVATADGVYLVWATLPASLSDANRGDRVRFTATLTRGRDAHFALGKRPSKAMKIDG